MQVKPRKTLVKSLNFCNLVRILITRNLTELRHCVQSSGFTKCPSERS